MKPFTFKRNGQEFGFTPLIGMTEDEVRKLVPEYAGEGAVPAWTLERVLKAFKAADLKLWAKELGFKSTGKEADVGKALLAAGFDFDKRASK